MIYLDYAANTPVDTRVMEIFIQVTKDFYGNPNSHHNMGLEASNIIEKASKQMITMLEIEDMDVIYTSGASEANNLAIKGIAGTYGNRGKHIISTPLEHSSVSGALTYLQSIGYEIDLLAIKQDGTIDLEQLEKIIREDTILVSICYVDSELGVLQPIMKIGELLKSRPSCFFHIDATQAVGKVIMELETADLITFAPHKFYGLNGMGVLLRNKRTILTPLIHGGVSTTIFRSGTPNPAAAAATSEALNLALSEFNNRMEKVILLKAYLIKQLRKIENVRFNSPENASPYFLNISVRKIMSWEIVELLNSEGVYLSAKSACSVAKLPSRAVFAVTGDKKNAKSSFRISLSHLTSIEEINEFIEILQKIAEGTAVL